MSKIDVTTHDQDVADIAQGLVQWHAQKIEFLKDQAGFKGEELNIEAGTHSFSFKGRELAAFRVGVFTAMEAIKPFPLKIEATEPADDLPDDDEARHG